MASQGVGLFDSAVANLGFKPKGVKVGAELYKELVHGGRVERQRALIGGILDIGLELPYLDGDIYVHVDPELDDWAYELPSHA